MRLHYGDSLPRPRVAFRLEGPANAPVVAVLGGISAHRHLIVGRWWPATVGPGLGVDSHPVFVSSVSIIWAVWAEAPRRMAKRSFRR